MKPKMNLKNGVAAGTTTMMLALSAMSVSAGDFLPGSHRQGVDKQQEARGVTKENEKESWTGTASCTVECGDGSCKVITATCNAAASYADAKRKLKTSLETTATLSGGKVKGSITFSISKSF